MKRSGDQKEEIWIQLPPNFPLEDLAAISNYLSKADICVPGYVPPPVGLYHPFTFIYEHQVNGTHTTLLIDRNVASRIAQLAHGRSARSDPQVKTSAALLAFCQCLDVEIEPGVAFHELAQRSGNDVAHAELTWFRAADNARPEDIIAVALNRREAIAEKPQPLEVSSYDLAKPPKRWNRNYIIALKMMELERLPIKPVDRIMRLLQWMHDDFIFGGPAALLASVYFAPNSPPKRRVFKDKNSTDREAAIAGVRNAAWDLTQLSELARRVNEAGPAGSVRYLFATFDNHLRGMTKLLFQHGADQPGPGHLMSTLSRWWPPEDARRIASLLFDHLEWVQSPEWIQKRSPKPNFIQELINDGERVIRNEIPRSHS